MIIALTGPAGCGKSTLAQVLVQRHDFVRVRFAGPLKAMLRALGLTEAQVDSDEKEVPCALLCGHTPRHAMKTLGTEWGREKIGRDIWVNATLRAVDDLVAGQRDVVIDDLRFDNEARALAARGALIVQVNRPGIQVDDTHESEQGIAPTWVSARLNNNDTIEAAGITLAAIITAYRSQGRHDL